MHHLLNKHKSTFPEIKSLYPYQEEVLEILLRGENTLAIISTGGGKSLLYQLMALELEGLTLVISPLVALMDEQVQELVNRGIKALALNSTLTFEEQRKILRSLKKENYRLIYVSPERLQNTFFKACLIASGVKVSMIAIDEAHCISQWGVSFRPDYSQINGFIDFLNENNNHPFLFCLTATLSKIAREDIAAEFKIPPQNIIVKSVIRSNLKLNFKKVQKEKEKTIHFNKFLKGHQPNKTVAYLYSKGKCEEYAAAYSNDYRTSFYHASVDTDDKAQVFRDFTKDGIQLLFATTAFGMGINIPDIESVVHLQIPNSVEEYCQQVGRGWRKKNEDKDCHCLALWSDVNFDRRKRDVQKQKYDLDYFRLVLNELLGGTVIKHIGQVVNKDKEALLNSKHNLRLLKFKLERHGLIRHIGEINGSPLTIELHKETKLWNAIVKEADAGMDSFVYISEKLKIPIAEIMGHLFEQDLKANIKKLPAIRRDVYFEVLTTEIRDSMAQKIISEINDTVDFRLKQLEDLKDLFSSENDITEKLLKVLN